MDRLIAAIKTRYELLRLMPDLSLRTTFVVSALALIALAFIVGDLHGRRGAAESQLAVTGALPFTPYAERVNTQSGAADAATASSRNFVASENGSAFYPIGCKSVARIREENRIYFASVAEAKLSGRTPAKGCTFSE